LPSARAEWLAKAGRTDESIAEYEALLKRSPSNRQAANNLSELLAETKGDKASLDRALQLASRFDSSLLPGELDTLAMVHYRSGEFAKASALLQRAVDLAPGEPLIQLHLGMALFKGGDTQGGKVMMRKAIDSKAALPSLPEARSMLDHG
jgi:Flp pilus assembly protein TadD